MNIPGESGALRTAAPQVQRANFRHLYADIFWFGVLSGSTLAFQAIFVTRLGATAYQVGLLTAGPAVINLLFSLPAGRWVEGRPLIPLTFWTAALMRVGYLALIFLPWLFAPLLQVRAVLIVVMLISLPATILAISFFALFAGVVPAELRGEVVGKRNALVAVSMTVTTLLCGQILDRLPFPFNYQVVFGMGGLGAILSTYHLYRLRLPGGSSTPAPQPQGASASLSKSLVHLRSRFGLFILAYLAFYTFQYMGITLFPLSVVRLLKLTDAQISLGSALFYTVMLLVSLRLGRISQRVSHRRQLYLSALAFATYPLLLGLARGPVLQLFYWLACLLGGGIWAVISAALLNRLMEVAPEDNRPPYMTWHNIALNLGILLGSLVAPWLGEIWGLQNALLLTAALRILAGVLLVLWG